MKQIGRGTNNDNWTFEKGPAFAEESEQPENPDPHEYARGIIRKLFAWLTGLAFLACCVFEVVLYNAKGLNQTMRWVEKSLFFCLITIGIMFAFSIFGYRLHHLLDRITKAAPDIFDRLFTLAYSLGEKLKNWITKAPANSAKFSGGKYLVLVIVKHIGDWKTTITGSTEHHANVHEPINLIDTRQPIPTIDRTTTETQTLKIWELIGFLFGAITESAAIAYIAIWWLIDPSEPTVPLSKLALAFCFGAFVVIMISIFTTPLKLFLHDKNWRDNLTLGNLIVTLLGLLASAALFYAEYIAMHGRFEIALTSPTDALTQKIAAANLQPLAYIGIFIAIALVTLYAGKVCEYYLGTAAGKGKAVLLAIKKALRLIGLFLFTVLCLIGIVLISPIALILLLIISLASILLLGLPTALLFIGGTLIMILRATLQLVTGLLRIISQTAKTIINAIFILILGWLILRRLLEQDNAYDPALLDTTTMERSGVHHA